MLPLRSWPFWLKIGAKENKALRVSLLSLSGLTGAAAAGMAIDPTKEEISAFTTLNDISTWAALPQVVQAAIYQDLSADGTEHYRLIGMFATKDIDDLVDRIEVPGPEGQPGRPLTRLQKLAAQLFIRACRVAAGVEKSVEQSRIDHLLVTAPAAPAHTGAAASQDETFKITLVMDQASETVARMVGKHIIENFYAAYRQVFGVHRAPPEHKDLTPEQISAFFYRLGKDVNPYC